MLQLKFSLAIDLGTTRTKVAYWDPGRETAELMVHGEDEKPYFPSLFHLSAEDDGILWGWEAQDMLGESEGRTGVIDDVKPRLLSADARNPSPCVFANRRRVPVVDVLTALLADLRRLAGESLPVFGGRPPSSVVLTRPVILSREAEALLREAGVRAGFSQVQLVREPISAAMAWTGRLAGDWVQDVVVFDGGGGTIDWAWLRREDACWQVVSNERCPPGGLELGGRDVDQALLERLMERADDAGRKVIAQNRVRFLDKVRQWKERVGRGLPISSVKVAGRSVSLKPADITAALSQVFTAKAVARLSAYVAQVVEARGGNDGLKLLVVGGSSQAKGFREALAEAVTIGIVGWDRALFAVPLGAIETPDKATPVATETSEKAPAPTQILKGRWPDRGCVFRYWAVDGGTNTDFPDMVVIPPGTFKMGSPNDEVGRWEEEGPQHEVVLKNSFAMGRYAVTVGEFRRFVVDSGHEIRVGAKIINEKSKKWVFNTTTNWDSPGFPQDEDHPVTCVTWADAQAYIAWLMQRTGQEYRLPSESEWEYAARAETRTRFWWGDEITKKLANYGLKNRGTVAVARYSPNPFGLSQVHGNVWEWVEDRWHSNYERTPSNGCSWTNEDTNTPRVLRGGSWYNNPRNVRSASRHYGIPVVRNNVIGFRLARTIKS